MEEVYNLPRRGEVVCICRNLPRRGVVVGLYDYHYHDYMVSPCKGEYDYVTSFRGLFGDTTVIIVSRE
jgi:hypothetical protein